MRRWAIGLVLGLFCNTVAAPYAVAQRPGYGPPLPPPPYGPAYPYPPYGAPPGYGAPPPAPPSPDTPIPGDAAVPYGQFTYQADPDYLQQYQQAQQPSPSPESATAYPPSPAYGPPPPRAAPPYAAPYPPPAYSGVGYAPPSSDTAAAPSPPPVAAAAGAAPSYGLQAAGAQPPSAPPPSVAAPNPAPAPASAPGAQRLCIGGVDLSALLSSLGQSNTGGAGQSYTLGTYMYGPGVTQTVPYTLQSQVTPYNVGALPRLLTGYNIPVQGGQPGVLIQQPVSLDPGGTTNLSPSSGC